MTAAPAPTLAPPTADNWRLHATCATRNPDLWFRGAGSQDLARWQRDQALAICYACPVRRWCIEDEMRAATTDRRRAMTRGGWWWTAAGRPHPHPADGDLMRRHYPTKETR